MEHFRLFVLPFWLGALFLLVALLYKYILWFVKLEPAQRRMFFRSLPTRATLRSLGEIASESLLHRKIWRRNKLLGYMHTSFALGWFLLIVVGWTETLVYFKGENVPLYVDIFFSYYVHPIFEHNFNFSLIKDALLLLILVGVGLAWFKRIRSRAMGMRRTTRHVLGDRVALSALWFVFPVRLIAESTTCALYGGGGFLTGSVGAWMAEHVSTLALMNLESAAWWAYSACLGIFFVALPFSRYMHIFTEIPLIFLRHYELRSTEKEGAFDHFQVEACSRCGICIDPCQLQSVLGINDVQSVYFLRDRRYRMLRLATADNCLMCGRCAEKCPVGIDLNTLRVNSRDKMHNVPDERRYGYFKGLDRSEGAGKVGYFAGCMTLLTPRTMSAMSAIFEAAGEEVWWADREGGVCCGRPLKLAGETDSARKMMKYNADLFRKHGITTLVTSCPICLKVFREDYDLPGIEILHHSEYILRLIRAGRLSLEHGAMRFTYHDPCELGRGSGIYDEPRAVIGAVGELLEPASARENALCCGSSVANTAISDEGQLRIARAVGAELEATGAEVVVTACPLCKKALGRGVKAPVRDLAEVVADSLVRN